MSATVAQPSQANRPQQGTQKRLFRSISRFLSGKQKPQKPANARTPPSSGGGAVAGAGEGADAGLPLGDVRSSTRSTSTGDTASTSMQDDDDSLSRLSAVSGADTDASLRPISPSSVGPASSVISRTDSTSNASFAPTHGTFKSYASTKPTTLSLDSGGGGANRIAVVPATGHASSPLHQPTSHSHLLPTSSSGGSLGAQPHTPSSLSGQPITFSALPASNPSTPLETPGPSTPSPAAAPSADPLDNSQVPRHTLAHPRNNPHPASPPPDNASMITLASSSFAPSFSHPRTGGVLPSAASGTGSFGGGGLTGLRAWRKGDEGGADEDASVRVLAGSRRASDESLGGKSTWSAAIGRSFVGAGGVARDGGGGGAPSVRTVGTTGTGGDLLSQHENEHERGEDESRRQSVHSAAAAAGGETEAQKVVRHEGVRDDLARDEAEASSSSSSAQPLAPDTPTNLTPRTELDSPPLGSPVVERPPTSPPSEGPTSTAMVNTDTLTMMMPPPVPSSARVPASSTSAAAAEVEDGTMTPTRREMERGKMPVRSLSIGSGTETDADADGASFADAQSQLSADSRL